MKPIKSNTNPNDLNTNLNPLVQPLTETAQETICGGAAAASGGSGLVVPVKIKHGV
ncbi:hypothetical protein IFO70_23610 [Phormidium tenue FACHB-886]|nr:hypothetical protein [Phormidium tenue FACHB-886]